MKRGSTMPLPARNWTDDELFDIYEESKGPFLAHREGRPDLVVVSAQSLEASDETSDEDIARIRRGIQALDQGERIDARASLANIRAKYGL